MTMHTYTRIHKCTALRQKSSRLSRSPACIEARVYIVTRIEDITVLVHLYSIEETPVDERIVHEGLQHGDDAFLVCPQHTHGLLAAGPEVALNAGHLHCLDHHPRQPEGDLPKHKT